MTIVATGCPQRAATVRERAGGVRRAGSLADHRRSFAACLMLMATFTCNAADHDAPLFERDITPILDRHCNECHGERRARARLDLRTMAAMLRGGESGPAIVRGHPEMSLLIELIAADDMPPDDRPRLMPEELALLRKWIQIGAPSREKVAEARPTSQLTDADRDHWAFKPPVKPPVPGGFDASRSPIDAFIAAKLAEAGLAFSPQADRAALIRRVTFDLIGLPPTPDDLRAFINDTRPDAYEQLVDRLLASPQFGVKWARHWLDAAGYADTAATDNDLMSVTPNEGIWRYRDWVVDAFNADMPYDRFLTEQLAGDELADWRNADQFSDGDLARLIATGYLRNVPDVTIAPQYGLKERYDVLFDLVSMVSSGVMGVTMKCAQCHDHKYEPITQRDYYRFMGLFMAAYNPQRWVKPDQRFLMQLPPLKREEAERHNRRLEEQVKPLREKFADLNKRIADGADADKSALLAERETVSDQIDALQSQRIALDTIQGLWDVGKLPDVRILRRGQYNQPAEKVMPGFPAVLMPPGREHHEVYRPEQAAGDTTGYRLALAQWLTAPAHPLTGRVFVNRVWRHLFGRGIVDPPDNFGRSGAEPSHHELLDHLAVDFASGGGEADKTWRVKRIIRSIVLSTAYRQASTRHDAGERIDPDNRLLWRQNLRRLEAEQVRDAVLAVSGALNPALGGKPTPITSRPDGLNDVASDGVEEADRHRRTLYIFARRNYPLKLLELFDYPLMPVNATHRVHSTTVLQSLTQLNSPFMLEAASRVADRLADDDPAGRITRAYELILSRPPDARQIKFCETFLVDQAAIYRDSGVASPDADRRALADLCHMLLCGNAFLYAD